ncbi:MAG TPA: glycosyltransferase family 2 protein, partial [Candidatus Krumholzibacteria bacterium]|jgi:cellulose synthase/poly-beta-1,6-N-acetylglucosamine synthase-like glycosyltransferase
MSQLVSTLLAPFELMVVLYSLLYLACNVTLIILAFRPLLDQVRGLGFADLGEMDAVLSTIPAISIIVPAYNEEKTIVESVRSLMQVDYPQIEIVVVNDGSTDRTMEYLREAFTLQRRDVSVREEIETATVRAVCEARKELPSRVVRFLVVDKENGGRADALNAGLNACISPNVLLIDADCIVDPQALKQVVRMLQVDPSIVSIGGQIGVINDCQVEGGKIVRTRIPRSYLALCQMMEYLRAFSLMRTGFSRLNCLPIVSGAFMVMTRQIVMEVGGFLTGRSSSRLLDEYVGPGKQTICEDMEITLRIHRYLRQRGLSGRIVHTPLPLVWTEVPANRASLGKQRRRWHRGFLEILSYHRNMILNPDYGAVGIFALPYLLWFELLGPYIEALGLFVLPLLALLGLINPVPALLIMSIALGAGALQSLVSVLGANWMERTSPGGTQMRSLSGADRWKDRWLLLLACFISELGYRQMTLIWRIHGTWDYFRGHTGWDKFERKGFKSSAALLAFLLLLLPGHGLAASSEPGVPEGALAERESTIVLGSERRGGRHASWWYELTTAWNGPKTRRLWAGLYHAERDTRVDAGVIAGIAGKPLPWAGFGSEFRLSPQAHFTPRWSWSGESEAVVHGPLTGTLHARVSRYPGLTAMSYGVGAVYYGPRESWITLRLLVIDSYFREQARDRLIGGMGLASVRVGAVETRFNLQYGGESYLISELRGPDDIRAVAAGAELRVPVGEDWVAISGVNQRWPERGSGNLYIHGGLKRRW